MSLDEALLSRIAADVRGQRRELNIYERLPNLGLKLARLNLTSRGSTSSTDSTHTTVIADDLFDEEDFLGDQIATSYVKSKFPQDSQQQVLCC